MKELGSIAVYVVIGLMTFGRVYNTTECTNSPFLASIDRCQFSNALFGGMFWPLYWGGSWAIYLTKTETKK